MASTKASLTFEAALQELTNIVSAFEQNDASLTLDQSFKSFERGIELTRFCQKHLARVEQKIKILSSNEIDAPLQDFNVEHLSDDHDEASH